MPRLLAILPAGYAIAIATMLFGFASVHAASVPAAALMIGNPAPAFKLQDQNGLWHTLDEYKGKWLVLYFYPKDQTPGCTAEACEFRDNVFAFRDANAVIVGISIDSVESHEKFAGKHSLPFTLLADPTKETAKAYGVLKKFVLILEMAKRETFLVDPNGRIAKIYRNVDPKIHAQAVLGEIKSRQQ